MKRFTITLVLTTIYCLFIMTTNASANRCAPNPYDCSTYNAGSYRYLCGTSQEFDCSFVLEMHNCESVICEDGTSQEMLYDCRIWPWCKIRIVKNINSSDHEVTVVWGVAILDYPDPEICPVDECFFGEDCDLGGAPECAYANKICPD